MFGKTRHTPINFLLSLLVLTFALPATATVPCYEGNPLNLNESWMESGIVTGPAYHDLSLSEPGVLMITAANLGVGPEVVLNAYVRDGRQALNVAKTPAAWIIATADAADFSFVVQSENGEPLDGYKLHTAFEPVAVSRLSVYKNEEDDEDDVEQHNPDVLESRIEPCASDLATKGNEVEPYDPIEIESRFFDLCDATSTAALKTDDDEDDVEQHNPDVLESRFAGSCILSTMCRQDDIDDHGDSVLCSTMIALGDDVAGRLENGSGDDADYYSFNLRKRTMVRLGVDGLFGAGSMLYLYDERGQRIDNKAADNGDLVRTLEPGSYYVRLISESQTPYILTLR